ncbi:MAG: cytochrome b/b6 domain-containing protein [Armatimonadetes bacterium]|nr:cytochrome b/b6 domain-containing protein [Armatimonadota bacterium]
MLTAGVYIGHPQAVRAQRKALPLVLNGPQDNEICLACHTDPKTHRMVNGRRKSLVIDGAAFEKSTHARMPCTDCHRDIQTLPHPGEAKPVNCDRCHHKIIAPSGQDGHANIMGGVHEKARRAGNLRAPECKTCHGTHEILSRQELASPISRKNIHDLCGRCHRTEHDQYSISVHAVAVTHDIKDAPTCIECHGEHSAIQKVTDPASTVYPTNISRTCSQCHGEYRLAARYNIRSDRTSTYEGSFHGIGGKFGVATVANCASCHGWHEILPSSDPRSTVNVNNLQRTCGQEGCHPNATRQFARGAIHGPTSLAGSNLANIITVIYILLIAGTIGGMLIHNALDFRTLLKKRGQAHAHTPGGRTFNRMNISERVQHLLMFVSFFMLALTGFLLYLPEDMVKWLGPHPDRVFWLRGTIHRGAALMLIAVSIYHIIWVIANRRGREQFRAMLPSLKDVTDVLGMFRYYLFGGEKPKFGRYGYKEKAEYWALVWGTFIMSLTGFILWWEEISPILAIQLSRLVHRYEAILAVLAIVVWHFYLVHWRPGAFPMSRIWIDGKITEEEMREEHELEYEAIMKKEEAE